MGTKRESPQFKWPDNQRAEGVYSHHPYFHSPSPTFPAKHQVHHWGARTGLSGASLASPELKHLARRAQSFLPEGNGASRKELLPFPAQPQAPPPLQQVQLEASPLRTPTHWLAPHIPESWVGLSLMPPLSSAELTWLLITHRLYYFSFVL